MPHQLRVASPLETTYVVSLAGPNPLARADDASI
jgi:hypothetical protein